MGLNGSIVKNLKSLYKGQQAAVRVESEITDWFKIGNAMHCIGQTIIVLQHTIQLVN